MDTNVVAEALLAGAIVAAKGIGTQAVKDGYNGLKSKVQEWFSEKKKPEGNIALAKIEEKPEIWKEPLNDSLIESEADKNSEILELAKTLIETIKDLPEARQTIAKYNLNIKNSKIGIVGDEAKIETMSL